MTDSDPNGVVVVQHRVLVYEHYFAGLDDWSAGGAPSVYVQHDANTLHDLQSITKSVVGLLAGIVFDHAQEQDLNASVLSFFPHDADLRTPGKDRITVRDLLTMTSGLTWPEHAVSYNNSTNVVRQMARAPDPYHFVLEQPTEATPGTKWNYDSGGVEVIGAILRELSGVPLDVFAKRALFVPLGIEHWEWLRLPGGQPAASWGLRLRPRDLAKIGQLVLDHGAWHGHQIVSAAWIKQMTAPHKPSGVPSGYAYGYLWWRGSVLVKGHDINWVGGIGLGGQLLYVVPSEDLVVVSTAGNYRGRGPQNLVGHTALDMVLRAMSR